VKKILPKRGNYLILEAKNNWYPQISGLEYSIECSFEYAHKLKKAQCFDERE
jgi:hypothetical protein